MREIASSVKQITKSAADFIKRNMAGVAAIALVTVTAGTIIVPPILRCANNNSEMNCRSHIFELNVALEKMLKAEVEEGGDYIQRMIEEGNSGAVINRISGITSDNDKFNASDYYFTRSSDRVEIRCRKHEKATGFGTILSSIPNIRTNFTDFADEEKIVLLTAKGPNKYNINDVLDASDTAKRIFRGDEINKLINNLTVTAHYMDGSSKTLGRGDYTVTCGVLDMGIAGKNVLTVRTKSKSLWNDAAYTRFILYVIDKNDIGPLIIEVQNVGKYELAAWEWKDFVAEAEEIGGETFGASIVLWDGKYYYYPDGFTIEAGKPNTDPFVYAYDTDSSEKGAYCIEFDTDSIIVDKNDKPHNGSVRAEKDLIYIWQEKPSKELPAGWIRVYCDLQKY
ncbi:MAG: hypothetical protein J1F71_07085 [Clostridiales bacterium]|nr:hypothetical protein [Clostridiales bacterium]